jgi:hypothetical protein
VGGRTLWAPRADRVHSVKPTSPSPRILRVLLLAWIAGFAIGTTTHILDLAFGGLATYAGFPNAVRLFWVSLTVLDPLIIVLMVLRRRAGVYLGIGVILADILVNWTVLLALGGITWWGVINQTAFALFIGLSAPHLLRWFGAKTTS